MANNNVSIKIDANTLGFDKAIGRVGKNLKEFGDSVGRPRDALGRFIPVAKEARGGIVGLGNASSSSIGSVSALGGSFTKLLKPLLAVGAAYITVRTAMLATMAVIKTNMTFEDTMAQVKAVAEQNVGFTINKFKDMQAEARRLGATTRFSASEAAEGLKFLSMAGFTAEQATESLESTLQLAQAGSLGLGRAADIVSNIMTAFGASTDQTQKFVDVLAKTAANANTDVEQLGQAMKFVAPAAAGMKRGVEETSAAIAVLSSAGIQSEMAGTGLRNMLVQLADQNSKAVRTLKSMGAAYEDLNPTTNSFSEILGELADKGVDATNSYTLFGQRAGSAVAELVKSRDAVGKLTGSLLKSEGAAAQMAKTTDDTFKGSLLRLKSAYEELLLVLGEGGFMDLLRGIVDKASGVLAQATQAAKVLKQVYTQGNLGRLFFAGIKLGAIKGLNFLLGGLLTVFKLAGSYLAGIFRLLTSKEYWSSLFSVYKDLGLILLGAVAQFEAELIRAATPFLSNVIGGLAFVGGKFSASLKIAATAFVDLMLSGVQKILTQLNKVSDIFGVDLTDAIDRVKSARDSNKANSDDAKAMFKLGFQDYKDGAKAVLGSLANDLEKGGKMMVNEGSNSIGESSQRLGKEINKQMLAPMGKVLSEFEPTNLFKDQENAIQKEFSNIWSSAEDAVPESKKKVEGGKLDKKALLEDPTESKAQGGEGAKLVADSLQSIGGGGLFGGIAEAKQDVIADASKKTSENTAKTNSLLSNIISPSLGLSNAPAIGTVKQSNSQTIAILTDIREILTAIRDKPVGGTQPIAITTN